MSVSEQTPTEETPQQAPVVVKKYANRRLYNTESSSYITLDSLAGMIRVGRDFVVYDAKTGEDITRGVLTQIIVDEESKGRAILPTAFLRQVIGFYGDSMQQLMPAYLEQALTSFAVQQEQMRSAMQHTVGNLFPFPGIQEVSRQNMAMMERAMSLFSPFYRPTAAAAEGETPQAPQPDPTEALRSEIESLKRQLAAAQANGAAPATSNGVDRDPPASESHETDAGESEASSPPHTNHQ